MMTTLGCLLGWLAESPACQAGMMRLLPLQQPTNAVSWEPLRISPNGRWVGGNYSDAQGTRHGVVWRDLSVVYTVSPWGDATTASITDVNDFGVASGNLSGPGSNGLNGGTKVSGFVASSTGTRLFDGFSGMPNYSMANAINNNGRVVGQAIGGGYRDVWQSAVWESNAVANSPFNLHYAMAFGDAWFGFESSWASAVTEAGQVLGEHYIPAALWAYHANSDLTKGWHGNLGNPPDWGHITATSNHGPSAAGFRYGVVNSFVKGFHTNSDEAFANGGFSGTWTNLTFGPAGVNDKGVVVGSSGGPVPIGYLYANQTYSQLDSLLSEDDRALVRGIRGATDITNSGLIAIQTNSQAGYLLAPGDTPPVPEPGMTALTLLAVASVLLSRRLSKTAA